MKTVPSVVAGAALLLAMSAFAPGHAQPAPGGAVVAAKHAKPAKKAATKKAPEKKLVPLTNVRLLEKVLGKPFTDDQKDAFNAAATAYNESVAKTAGLTAGEVTAKIDEYKKANAAAKKAAGATPKVAAPAPPK